MKRKMIFAALAAVCAGFGLCACGDPFEADGDVYESLNAMLNARYSEIVLTVTDAFGEDTLTSVFSITGSDEEKHVAYTVERFAGISAADPASGSAVFKKTLTGEAVFKDGFLLSATGDEVALPAVLGRGLSFKAEYFENVRSSNGYFFADVKDAAAFSAAEFASADMEVKATFSDVFYDITVSYTSAEGNAVTYRFAFER